MEVIYGDIDDLFPTVTLVMNLIGHLARGRSDSVIVDCRNIILTCHRT